MTIPWTHVRRARHRSFGALLALAVSFVLGLARGADLAGPAALACSCPTQPASSSTPRQALEVTEAVFDGTVIGIDPVDPADPFSDRRVTLRVLVQWKGVTTSTVTLTTAAGSAMCGVEFRLGERYIVYMNRHFVHACGRTRRFDAAEAAALGPGTPPALVGHFGGRITAVAADPDQPGIAWLGQGPRVVAADVRDPAAPRLLGSGLLLPRGVDALAVDAPNAVALSHGRLYVIDVSDPARPAVLRDDDFGALGASSSRATGHVALFGRLAAVAYAMPGLRDNVAYIDIVTGARSPGLISNFEGRITDLVAAGNRLAVATRTGYSPLDPGKLRLLTTDVDEGAPGWGVRELVSVEGPVVDRLAFARVGAEERIYALSGAGLAGWAIVDGEPLREVRRCPREWRPAGTDAVKGDLAVTPAGDVFVALVGSIGGQYIAGVVVKVRDGAAEGECAAESVYATIRPLDTKLLAVGDAVVMAEMTGLKSLDPASSTTTSLGLVVDAVDIATSTTGGETTLVAISDQGTLAALDPTDPASPTLSWAVSAAFERGALAVDDGVASAANYGAGDIDDRSIDVMAVAAGPPAGRPGRIDLRDAGGDVRFDQSGRNLVVRSGPDTLSLVDLTDPAAPVVRSSIDLAGQVSDVAVDGRRVVVAQRDGAASGVTGTETVRVTMLAVAGEGDTLHFERGGTVVVEPYAVVDGNLPRIAIDGDIAWLVVAHGCPGDPRFVLRGVDVSDLAAPAVIDRAWADVPERSVDIVAADGHVFLPGERTWIVDVRNARAPAVVGMLDTGVPALNVAVHERTVYVASGAGGVYVLQPTLNWASDPTIPTPSPEAVPTFAPSPTFDCRPTATPSPTPFETPIPSQMTCTPPPCPCGRIRGVCPGLYCEACTATPTAPIVAGTTAWLPWAGRASRPQP